MTAIQMQIIAGSSLFAVMLIPSLIAYLRSLRG
jgi:hypothetical protein